MCLFTLWVSCLCEGKTFIAYASSFWWAPLFGQICSGELALI